jgi:hypothetical protein
MVKISADGNVGQREVPLSGLLGLTILLTLMFIIWLIPCLPLQQWGWVSGKTQRSINASRHRYFAATTLVNIIVFGLFLYAADGISLSKDSLFLQLV